MKKVISKSFSEHKTAKVLSIVSVFLWAVFVMVRLLLPKGTFLIGQADGWLFAAAMLFSWISCGFGWQSLSASVIGVSKWLHGLHIVLLR